MPAPLATRPRAVAAAEPRWSSGGDDGEAARELLQGRLALFGKVGGALGLVYYALVNGLRLGSLRPRALVDETNLYVLGVCALLGLAWLLLARGRWSITALRAIDSALLLLTCVLASNYGWEAAPLPGYELVAVLTLTNVLVFRAAIVPSGPLRTAVLGTLAALPVIVPAFAVDDAGAIRSAAFAAWSAVAVSVSSVVSLVIFGLTRKVARAERLGSYTLEERLGGGGMGHVFRARHAMLRRPTAIKLLRPDLAGAQALAQFEREVQLTSQLTHPNTIAVFDYGRTPDGVFYYAMELLDGVDLDTLVRRVGPQSPARVIYILRQICGSLAEAHAAGLIHRDMKAANVMLCTRGGEPDFVKVLDFGLVEELDGNGAAREPDLRGTLLYLSPEAIATPGEVTHLTDIYAVGVLAYYLLTGSHPFTATDAVSLLCAQVTTPVDAPSLRRGAALPADLERLVLRCLDRAPAERPPSATALAAMLGACVDAGDWSADVARAWWAAAS